MGTEKKSHKYSEKAKKLTAYHEAGHAVSSFYVEGHDPVKEISIIPRGLGAGGYTWYTPQEENYNSKKDMLDNLVTLLGGRVAEALTLDDISTGASNDLQRATDICRDMVAKYGMSDALGPVVYTDEGHEVFLGKDYGHVNNYSDATSARIDAEIEKLMREAYNNTESILSEHKDKLILVAETLIKKEKLNNEEFESLMNNGCLPTNNNDTVVEATVTDDEITESNDTSTSDNSSENDVIE
jgi:cell division protease FtsH